MTAISQISCFSSVIINNNIRRFQLHPTRSSSSFRPLKVLNVMSGDGHGVKLSSSENKTTRSYVEDASILQNGNSVKPHPLPQGGLGELDGHIQEQVVSQPQKTAKIHDFCLGIPFGGIVLIGAVLGFIFSRNLATLTSGVLYGGALLGLSTFSMKVWKQGKSSAPFILAQAALSAALLWKNFQTYALTKSIFPSAFNGVVSAAMLCFYAYVMISGGNPPPKKKSKSPAIVES